MAEQFIGLHMWVCLRTGQDMKGTVSEVVTGQSLTLINVFETKPRHQWHPRLTISASDIVDLAEVHDEPPPSATFSDLPPTAAFTAPPAAPVAAPIYGQPVQPFTDPAILSLGKPPVGTATDILSHDLPVLPNTSEKRDPQPGQPGVLPPLHLPSLPREATPNSANMITDPVGALRISTPPTKEHRVLRTEDQLPRDSGAQSKKKTRTRKSRQPKPIDILDSSPAQPSRQIHGDGWRQTPILESSASFQPFNSLKKNGTRSKAPDPINGWASEDVTEEMGDFDFEGELAKFDKRTIFDQMRKDDRVDDADRLVSHNRLAKPGTAGGKNFHHTENVLDLPSSIAKPSNDFWNSEADDAGRSGEQRLSGRDMGSRQSNRRADSKSTVARRSQSRKASAVTVTGSQAPAVPRVNSGQLNRQPGFYLSPSNRRVETVSALQMLNLENIAANDLGLSEDMMTENAGRGIAEVVLTVLAEPAMQVKLGAVGGNSLVNSAASSSTIVILAGSNKSGIRAVAAGRTLRNKGVNVLLCVVGIEREQNLLEDMRRQVHIFRNMGGRVYSKIELFDHLRQQSSAKQPAAPPSVTLIVDALLGLTISFEELRTGDQATVYELIEWANRNEAFVLAVDVPTGIDPSTGKVSVIDGSRLYVKPRYVVSMGAPKRGLLEAMAPGATNGLPGGLDGPVGDGADPMLAHDDADEWRLFIADLGLGAAVWKKAGTKMRRGIDFDERWVLEMRYRGGSGTAATGADEI